MNTGEHSQASPLDAPEAPAIRILTNQTKRDHPYWLARTLLLPGWHEELKQIWGRQDGKWHWRDLYWGWRLFVASRQCDAVVTGSEHPALVFTVLQGLLRPHKKPQILIYTHWNLPSSRLGRWIRRVQHRYQVWAVSRVIVYSHQQLERYATELRLPREKLACVFYHTTLYDVKCSISEGGYVFSGGDYTRDYRNLVEAARGLPYRVIIAARLRTYFEGLRIPDNVHILTTTHAQFFTLMAGARVVVVPLRKGLLHSGGQQTYLNAMGMGKPVIVADDCGAEEYIVNGVNGVVVPAGDAAALRGAIEAVCEDGVLAQRLGENARSAAARFSPEVFVDGVLDIVKQCVERRNC